MPEDIIRCVCGCSSFKGRTFSPATCANCGHEREYHHAYATVEIVSGVTQEEMAKHYSAGKAPYDQIPVEALYLIAHVFHYGEGKYGRDNWKKGTKWHEFLGSALRHIFSWAKGEQWDQESHCHHLAHAIVNLMFLIYYEKYSIGEDDRDKQAVD